MKIAAHGEATRISRNSGTRHHRCRCCLPALTGIHDWSSRRSRYGPPQLKRRAVTEPACRGGAAILPRKREIGFSRPGGACHLASYNNSPAAWFARHPFGRIARRSDRESRPGTGARGSASARAAGSGCRRAARQDPNHAPPPRRGERSSCPRRGQATVQLAATSVAHSYNFTILPNRGCLLASGVPKVTGAHPLFEPQGIRPTSLGGVRHQPDTTACPI